MRGCNWRGRLMHSKLLANGECDKHTHTVRINTVILVDVKYVTI